MDVKTDGKAMYKAVDGLLVCILEKILGLKPGEKADLLKFAMYSKENGGMGMIFPYAYYEEMHA